MQPSKLYAKRSLKTTGVRGNIKTECIVPDIQSSFLNGNFYEHYYNLSPNEDTFGSNCVQVRISNGISEIV